MAPRPAARPCSPGRRPAWRPSPSRVCTLPPAAAARSARVDAGVDVSDLSAPPAWCRDDEGLPPCLRGNFRPVVGDATVDGLEVTEGAIPSDLQGVFARNGPNWAHEPMYPQKAHWFDGDGMIHYVRIEDGKAQYGRRAVRTRGYQEEQRAKQALHVGMLDLHVIPDVFMPRLAAKVMQDVRGPDAPFWVVQNKNNANNGLTYHAGRLLATWEAGWAYELALDGSLDALGPCTFGGSAPGINRWRENFSAHGKVCGATGELIYHGYSLIGPPCVMLGVVGPDGRISHKATVPTARATLQHDLAITETRTIILDQPLVFNQERALQQGRPFDFDGSSCVRYGVMPRHGSGDDVVWIEDPTGGYAFHVVNAWDDPSNADRVVLHTSRMPSTCGLGMAEALGVAEAAPSDGAYDADVGQRDVGHLWRTVLDVRAGTVVESARVGDIPSDFPCVAPSAVGQPSRYAYSVVPQASFLGRPVADDEVPLFDRVVKHDLAEGRVASTYELPPGRVCGDIAFAAGSGASGDPSERGYVLVLSHAAHADRSFLEVLDGHSLARVCELSVPVRVPYGFHAAFLPASVLASWPMVTARRGDL